MSTYRIKSVSCVEHDNNNQYEYWRKAELINNDFPSDDTMSVHLNPHASNEASAVKMINDIPHTEYVFRFKEKQGKPLDEWEDGDLIYEL